MKSLLRWDFKQKPAGIVFPTGFFLLYIFRESVGKSSAAAAYASENQQSDDDEPYNLITEKIAKAVHSVFLSSFIIADRNPSGVFSYASHSNIIVCQSALLCAQQQGKHIPSFSCTLRCRKIFAKFYKKTLEKSRRIYYNK